MTMTDLLPMRATVRRRQASSDGFGGEKVEWTTVITDYRCRIYGAGANVVRLPGGAEAISTHKVIGEAADLQAGDRLAAGDAVYEVLGPGGDAGMVRGSAGAHHVEALLRAV